MTLPTIKGIAFVVVRGGTFDEAGSREDTFHSRSRLGGTPSVAGVVVFRREAEVRDRAPLACSSRWVPADHTVARHGGPEVVLSGALYKIKGLSERDHDSSGVTWRVLGMSVDSRPAIARSRSPLAIAASSYCRRTCCLGMSCRR